MLSYVEYKSFSIAPIEDHLFPFGPSVGDSVVLPALDGVSGAIPKVFLGGTPCPFFGQQERILFVSCLSLWYYIGL